MRISDGSAGFAGSGIGRRAGRLADWSCANTVTEASASSANPQRRKNKGFMAGGKTKPREQRHVPQTRKCGGYARLSDNKSMQARAPSTPVVRSRAECRVTSANHRRTTATAPDKPAHSREHQNRHHRCRRRDAAAHLGSGWGRGAMPTAGTGRCDSGAGMAGTE